MARDYKNTAAKSKKEKKRPIGSWASFTSGLVLGLLVAFVVYVWRDKVPSVERAIEYHSTEQHHDDLGETVGDQTPAAEIASRETPKPRFDFYNILPEIEVKVPDWEIRNRTQGVVVLRTDRWIRRWQC